MVENLLKPSRRALIATGALAAGAVAAPALARSGAATTNLINVSYDPTRKLYAEINAAFVRDWKARTGQPISITQSHGGSVTQARAVAQGARADVVTLAHHVDGLSSRSPRPAPYASTMVMVVRDHNPHGVKDWGDLAGRELKVVAPSPAASGAGRWAYLAAWAWAARRAGETNAEAFASGIFRRAHVLDTSAVNATNTFAQRGIGDVLVTWEDEAIRMAARSDAAGLQIVYPSLSVEAEPYVAVVDRHVADGAHRQVAEAYLDFVYTPEAQALIEANHYRPSLRAPDPEGAKPKLALVRIEDFGGWREVERRHFS